eukprot:5600420-Alexandrium_andersonii.AAC.1
MIAHPVSWRTLVKGASVQVNKHFAAQHRARVQQEGGGGICVHRVRPPSVFSVITARGLSSPRRPSRCTMSGATTVPRISAHA